MERNQSEKAVKKFDEAFRRQAVEMVLQGAKSVKQIAEELGVSEYSIYEWKRKYFASSAGGQLPGKTASDLPQDVEQLQKLVREQQRQIADLRQQREVLKKTLGIVCEEPGRATSALR